MWQGCIKCAFQHPLATTAAEYHPSATILNENAPMSPNTILSTLAAHDEVPTETLREIITGLVTTIKIRKVAWEADRTAMRAHINYAEDHLDVALQAREDPDFDFDHAGVPNDFVCNNNRVPTFQIPIGEGLYLPAEFIKRDEDDRKKVWGVTGRFGTGEPAYAHKLYAHAVEKPETPTEPLCPWFLRLLQGSTANYS